MRIRAALIKVHLNRENPRHCGGWLTEKGPKEKADIDQS